AVELDAIEFAPPIRGRHEMLPVPRDPEYRKPAGLRIVFRIERPFNSPIVRQIQSAPSCVLECGLLRARSIAFEEAPTLIECHTAVRRGNSRNRDRKKGADESMHRIPINAQRRVPGGQEFANRMRSRKSSTIFSV